MDDEYFKDFENWHKLKEKIEDTHRPPTFNQREIWWASIGVNIGFEMDGKNQPFNRPVLVFKKINSRIFLGIPLTTQVKDFQYHHEFNFKGQKQCAILYQLRLFDSKRITHKMGWISPKQFKEIKREVGKMMNI